MDQLVVAASSPHPFGCSQIILPLQFDPGDSLRNVHQLVDRNHFRTAQIERVADVALHDFGRPLDAVVDVHEASRLLAVAPNFNFTRFVFLGLDHLPADRGGRFFAASIVRAVRAVYVVIADHPCLQLKILSEMAAHPFTKQLFPSVPVLWHSRIRVRLLQSWILCRRLLICRIDTG